MFTVRRGRIGAELVMPPTEDMPYYLQRNMAMTSDKSGAPAPTEPAAKTDNIAKKPETKEESEEEEEDGSDEEE